MKVKVFLIAIILPFFLFAQNSYQISKENSLLEPQLLQEDFKLLYRNLQQNHSRLYGYRTKQDADEDYKRILKMLQKPHERMDFYRLIAPFISAFKDAHTSFNMNFNDKDIVDYASSGGRFFPLEVIIIDNKLYCKANPHRRGNIGAGDEILSINAQPVFKMLPALRRLRSSDGEDNANANTQKLFGYIAWLYGLKGNEFEIEYIKRKKIVQEDITGITKEELMHNIFGDNTQKPEMHLYPKVHLAVVELNSYANVPESKDFIDSCFQVIKNQGIKNIALDLRQNSGGNSSVGDYFLAHLTRQPYNIIKRKSWRIGPLVQNLDSSHFISRAMEKVVKEYEQEGDMWHSPYHEPLRTNVTIKDSSLFQPLNLYVFTSAWTYSSAHMTALAVKCGQLGIIIGQPTGERLNLTGELMEYILPNTKFGLYIPAAAYESPCGNGDSVGVTPDFLIPYTVVDLRNDRDPELFFLLKLLKKENRNARKKA